MNKTEVIVGVLMLLTSLWGGSYGLSVTYGTWAGFPTVMTALGVGVLGLVVLMIGMEDD